MASHFKSFDEFYNFFVLQLTPFVTGKLAMKNEILYFIAVLNCYKSIPVKMPGIKKDTKHAKDKKIVSYKS